MSKTKPPFKYKYLITSTREIGEMFVGSQDSKGESYTCDSIPTEEYALKTIKLCFGAKPDEV
jgi:hypothetical protein